MKRINVNNREIIYCLINRLRAKQWASRKEQKESRQTVSKSKFFLENKLKLHTIQSVFSTLINHAALLLAGAHMHGLQVMWMLVDSVHTASRFSCSKYQ